MTAIATATKCDANSSGRAATDWGMDFLPCQTHRGLRSVMDAAGVRRFYCPASGHRENVVRRFGVYVSEADGDGLTAAKARDDLRDGVAHFDWRGHDIEVPVR